MLALVAFFLVFSTKHIFLLSSDLNRLDSTNGVSLPPAENAPVCPPTSGHLMAEKMRLGRQDQGDNDTGKSLVLYSFILSIRMEFDINVIFFIQLRREPLKNLNVSHHVYLIPKSY